MAGRFNQRSPAVKRILQEIKEITSDDSQEFLAEALEDNIFEWHYVVRGAPDTDFRGGIYHGRILLPADYPFKPPSFTMLTPNGRFETNTKICLSISSHHPEHWQPSWSVRTALTALVAFMPSPGRGAIGSLDYTADERRALATKSRLAPPSFGNAERQEVSLRLHQRMLELHPEDASTVPGSLPAAAAQAPDSITATHHQAQQQSESTPVSSAQSTAEAASSTSAVTAESCPDASGVAAGTSVAAPGPACGPSTAGTAQLPDRDAPMQAQRRPAAPTAAQWEDLGLTLLALVLLVLIAAILFRKLLIFSGLDIQAMLTQQP